MREFAPHDWYWLADDGRLYASARQAVVPGRDATYLAWRKAGGRPTRWPVNDNGAQTEAALQEVLSPYGLFIDLIAYAAAKRYWAETAGKTLTGGVVVGTDDVAQRKIAGVRHAFDNGTLASMDKVAFKAKSGWVDMGKTDIEAVHTAVVRHVQACYAKEKEVAAAITAGTITSTAEIDAAGWPA